MPPYIHKTFKTGSEVEAARLGFWPRLHTHTSPAQNSLTGPHTIPPLPRTPLALGSISLHVAHVRRVLAVRMTGFCAS